MTRTSSECPADEKLADLQANALSSTEAEEIRRHIAGCPACQERLSHVETVSPGNLSWNPNSETIAYADRGGEGNRARDSLHFLRPPAGPGELGRLGDYKVLRVMGSGGMGIVFEAEDIALSRRVALKVLRPDMADEEFRQRFLREARAAASLPHEHIVTIYQVGQDNDVPYLAMEYLHGQSLETRLQKDGSLPLADALDITRQAAEGLATAHEHGLIHRDVKPDNLWIESGLSGPVGRVKLLDFGLTRPAHGPSDLTAPGQVVGTPGYMAPEVVYGLAVDARADLYSLGCVFYRMLSGKTPFADEGLDTRALMQATAERDVLSAAAPPAELPPAVIDLLRDMLARDPTKRPPDARSVIYRMREIGQQLSVPLPSGSSGKRPRENGPDRRLLSHPGVWAGSLTILLALLVGLTFFVQRVLVPALSGPNGSEDSGSGAVAAAGDPIRVGVLYSTSGSFRYCEKPVKDATLLAIREINNAGGVKINGQPARPIEPIVADGASNEETFSTEAERLIGDNGVVCLFGCWTSSSRKRVEEVCARHNRLLVYAVPDEGLEESPYVFYLGGTPNQLMIPAVRWAYADLRKRRFFLAGSDYVFSAATHLILRHEIEALGGQVVGEALLPLGSYDFSAMAQQVEKSGADVVLCTVDGLSNVAFAAALRARNLQPPAMPTFWFNVGENELHYIDDARKHMVGDYASFCYFQSLDTPQNAAFLKRIRSAYQESNMAVTDPMEASYASVYLWKQAVEAAGSTETESVRISFRTQSFQAPEGLIKIDGPTQRASRTPRVGRINDSLNFDVVWAAPEPVAPQPYPPYKTRQEWDQFLQDLYRKWNGHWEAPARRHD